MTRTISGTWIKKSNSILPRHDHVCFLYQGKIYAVTGSNYETLNSIEVYDPVTDRWTEDAAPIAIARGWYGGTQIGEKFYVIGGKRIREETTFTTSRTFEFYNLVDEYDASQNKWRSLQSLPQKRCGAVATAHQGKIYLMGGVYCGDTLEETITLINDLTEIYDPAQNTWSKGPNMPMPLMTPTIQSNQDKIYLMGGFYDGLHRNEVYSLIPETGQWEQLAPMNIHRSNGSSVIYKNKILVFGGCSNETGFTDTCEMYDIDANQWVLLPSLPKAKAWTGSVVMNGRIFVHGGCNRENEPGEPVGEGHYSWYFKNELHELVLDTSL